MSLLQSDRALGKGIIENTTDVNQRKAIKDCFQQQVDDNVRAFIEPRDLFSNQEVCDARDIVATW